MKTTREQSHRENEGVRQALAPAAKPPHAESAISAMMNSSRQVRQLMEFGSRIDASSRVAAQRRDSGAVLQAKTTVNWSAQDFPYVSLGSGKIENATVGSYMEANLDPTEPVKGNDAESTHQAELYDSLKAYWNPGSKKWIRGHLLNANLGGPNVAVNLFPITGHANGDHLHLVENHVKKWVLDGRYVTYKVRAHRDTSATGRQTDKSVDIPNAHGAFECIAETTDTKPKKSIARVIESIPVPLGTGTGHASSSRKIDEKLDSEDAFAKLDDVLLERLDQILTASDTEAAFETFTKDLEWSKKILLGQVIYSDYKLDEDSEAEDSEPDKAGRVLNAGLKGWLNSKKLSKSEANQWLIDKKTGTNSWGVSSS